jgi:hypothetical protein
VFRKENHMAEEKPKSAEERPYIPREPYSPWYSAQFFSAELMDDDEPKGISPWEIVGVVVLIAAIMWGITE